MDPDDGSFYRIFDFSFFTVSVFICLRTKSATL